MSNKHAQLAQKILPLLGGKENVASATHCMTRLRLSIVDDSKVQIEEIKNLEGVSTVLYAGGQLQIVIGTTVGEVYEEFVKIAEVNKENAINENLDTPKKKGWKGVINKVFDYLSGTMTQLIPIMLAASLCKTIVTIFGPSALNVMPVGSSLHTLFTFMGDAGFYFMPIFIANFAAKKLNCNGAIAMLIGAIIIHPTLIEIATTGIEFNVYGIPCMTQNYSATVIPILMIVAVQNQVEKYIRKYCPDVLKVIVIPFFTLLIMTPIALCVLGPLGAFIGNYVSGAIIKLYDLVGPLAIGVIGGFFGIIVMLGMHQLLFVYLFTTFPMLGMDAFMSPGILAGSWAGLGVALACVWKFKKKENKSSTMGFIVTWLFGGVAEPLLYGLYLRYRTSLYASIISGFIAGVVSGIVHLRAYVLSVSSGIYGLASFLGGPTGNYIALAFVVPVSVVIGFVIMMMSPLNEE